MRIHIDKCIWRAWIDVEEITPMKFESFETCLQSCKHITTIKMFTFYTVPVQPEHIIQPWWRHQMETFSALLILYAGNSPVPVSCPHKGQWRRALMFSLICAWINDWVNKPWGWWFETPSWSLWRHCNDITWGERIHDVKPRSRDIGR